MTTKKNLDTGATIVELDGSSYISGSSVDTNGIKPVLIGGEVLITSSSFVTGTLQSIALDAARNLRTVNKPYDSPSAADRVIPVWSPPDQYYPQSITGSASTNGTTNYYMVMEENSLWSVGFTPLPGAVTASIGLRINYTNSSDDDVADRSYFDVTSMWGKTEFVSSSFIVPPVVTRLMSIRFDVILSDSEGATSTWYLDLMKGSNS